jgi:hypothetical protein
MFWHGYESVGDYITSRRRGEYAPRVLPPIIPGRYCQHHSAPHSTQCLRPARRRIGVDYFCEIESHDELFAPSIRAR